MLPVRARIFGNIVIREAYPVVIDGTMRCYQDQTWNMFSWNVMTFLSPLSR